MRIAIYRRLCFALLPGLFLSSTLVGDDSRISARRALQSSDPPEVILSPDADAGLVPLDDDQFMPDTNAPIYDYDGCDSSRGYETGSAALDCADAASDCCDSYGFCPCWTVRLGAV